ncbi:HtaA domain-containing protein [Microbacterium thalli]|uniref:HtaA domain-containing protein n=1 Tax=Microbacterium thalli TaxID=3027921 RepID=UPI002365FBC5|nr:HtaA domain-containing protein [Microbacterium thalli]MDD7928438.1 HtaA domain-containing protein [Microbacterium thalli]
MRSAVRRRGGVATLVAVAVAAAAITVLPVQAIDAEAAVPDAAGCTITDATVTWGFKESFRSYISGSIAKGAWEPFGGVGYETPVFTWTGGAGSFDPGSGTGTIAFPGGIRFSGHGGLLDTTVQNATVEIAPGSGRVLVDLVGVSMDSALAGDRTAVTSPRVPLVTLDLAGMSVDAADGGGMITLTATDAATAITAEGFEAFGNYETGTPFDPLTFTASGSCAAPTVTATPAAPTGSPATAETPAPRGQESSGGGSPAPVIAAVAVALVAVVGGTTAAVVATRRAREGSRSAGGPDA